MNSNLVNYQGTCGNNYSDRQGNAIDKIVIHHCAGIVSVEQLSDTFSSRGSSATYGIGSDGRIGQYVDESFRPWTTSSWDIDRRAVTIETSNDGGEDTDWHVSDMVIGKLIDLVTDICQRNGINPCTYTGDKDGVLQMHRWYAETSCPGDYLASKFGYIADEVNKRLGISPAPSPEPQPTKSIDEIAQEVIAGAYGNGSDRMNALTNAGYDANAVQVRVNQILGGGEPASQPSVDIEALANAVIAGQYGTGDDRRTALGANYDAVQARVNQILESGTSHPAPDIDDLARRTIAGEFGNGDDRKNALGANYDVVQARVNEMMRG